MLYSDFSNLLSHVLPITSLNIFFFFHTAFDQMIDMDVLINFDLRSDSKRQDAGALLDMLEFGSHCFITPSENINDVTRTVSYTHLTLPTILLV